MLANGGDARFAGNELAFVRLDHRRSNSLAALRPERSDGCAPFKLAAPVFQKHTLCRLFKGLPRQKADRELS